MHIPTKNISFPKGLARKLIPKYIGPYKILNDFKNQSFQIELPSHLKQRGVHDVFHAALLGIHVPNDDRLFPGRQFNQLNAGDDAEAEWAVDKILSHSGSSQDSVFEVLWKAGVSYINDHDFESAQLPNSPTIYSILLHPDMTTTDCTSGPPPTLPSNSKDPLLLTRCRRHTVIRCSSSRTMG